MDPAMCNKKRHEQEAAMHDLHGCLNLGYCCWRLSTSVKRTLSAAARMKASDT